MNTRLSGRVTHFVYRSKDRYVGVCLEFDIVDDDPNKEVLFERLQARAVSYVKYVCENEMDDALLNRHAPKKYWNLYLKALNDQLRSAQANISESGRGAIRRRREPPDVAIYSQLIPACV